MTASFTERLNNYILKNPMLMSSLTRDEVITLIMLVTKRYPLTDKDFRNLNSIVEKTLRYIQTCLMNYKELIKHIEKISIYKSRRSISKYARKNMLFLSAVAHRYKEKNGNYPEELMNHAIFMKTKIRFPDKTSIPYSLSRATSFENSEEREFMFSVFQFEVPRCL